MTTSRSANFPPAVLAHADALAAYHGVPRRAALLAACRAVLLHPPAGQVAYPTLDRAERSVAVPMPAEVRAAVVIAERTHFYGRFAWLCFYGMVRCADALTESLAAPPEVLALRDAEQYKRWSGGQPCLPPTARAPVKKRRR